MLHVVHCATLQQHETFMQLLGRLDPRKWKVGVLAPTVKPLAPSDVSWSELKQSLACRCGTTFVFLGLCSCATCFCRCCDGLHGLCSCVALYLLVAVLAPIECAQRGPIMS